MEKVLYDEMFRLERDHWWFAARRQIVLSLLAKFLPRPLPVVRRPRVCDLGCGCGMTLYDLAMAGYDAVGMDCNEAALKQCETRGAKAVPGTLPHDVPFPPASMDAVLLLDVLEHIDDDALALAAAMRLLKPGGVAICTTPAYRWLWTSRDAMHHHKRRYGRSEFIALLGRVESEKLLAGHMNCLLFPAALVQRLVARMRRPAGGAGDLSIPPLGLNCMLRNMFAMERFLLVRRVPLPFGLSLVGVLRRDPDAIPDIIHDPSSLPPVSSQP